MLELYIGSKSRRDITTGGQTVDVVGSREIYKTYISFWYIIIRYTLKSVQFYLIMWWGLLGGRNEKGTPLYGNVKCVYRYGEIVYNSTFISHIVQMCIMCVSLTFFFFGSCSFGIYILRCFFFFVSLWDVRLSFTFPTPPLPSLMDMKRKKKIERLVWGKLLILFFFYFIHTNVLI